MSSYYFIGQTAVSPVTGTTGTFTGNVTVGGTLGVTGTLTGVAGTFSGLVTGTGFKVTGSSAALVGNGEYLAAANSLGLATAGVVALTLGSTQLGTAAAAWQFPAGTGALPGVSVGGTADGMFQVSSGVVGFGGAGTEVARFGATLFQVPAASVQTWLSSTKLTNVLDGRLQISKNNGTGTADSTALVLGAATAGGGAAIALQTATTRLGAYLGDLSGFAYFRALGFSTSASGGVSSPDYGVAGGDAGFYFPTIHKLGLAANANTALIVDNPGDNKVAMLGLKSITAQTTLSLASVTTALVTIPAGSLVLMVTARVTTAITASLSTSWSLGTGVLPTDWGTTLAFASGTTVTGTNYVTFTGSQMFPAATAINCVLNTDAATAGVVRIVVYYVDVSAPTS